MGKIIILLPFHLIAAAVYVGCVVMGNASFLKAAQTEAMLPTGVRLVFDGEMLMILLTVSLLIFECIKSVLTGWASITNHLFSTVLFVASFGALMTIPAFSTKAWVIITLTMFADVLVGIVVTTIAARRDFDVG